MEFRFVDRTKQLTQSGRDQGISKLQFALSRFGDEIQHVTIISEDLNGPRGGTDKRCVLRAKLRRQGAVEVTQVGSEISECVGLGARRLGRSIRRTLDLRKQTPRSSVRRVEGLGVI